MLGAGGADRLSGTTTADHLVGAGGNDFLDGGAGADLMEGGAGDDRYYVDHAFDAVRERVGEGSDFVYASVSYGLRAGAEIEMLGTRDASGTQGLTLSGNEFANSVIGNAGANVLYGNAGADYLVGVAGNDLLDGGTGADIMDGGAGNDRYYVDSAGDAVRESAGQGSDIVYSSVSYGLKAGAEVETLGTRDAAGTEPLTLAGNEFANSVIGNAGHNALYGKGGADYLVGGAGNDLLDGGTGIDILDGGLGDDRYQVDSANDIVREFGGQGSDNVYASVSYALRAGAAVELLGTSNAAGTAALSLSGNEFNNSIVGNSGNNALSGGGGSDLLTALAGNDLLDGGAGKDFLSGGAGADTYRFSAATDSTRIAADTISDFTSGSDRIDLSAIDANAGSAGDGAFTWIGANAFTGVAGQLRAQATGSQTWVYGDVNGDAVADLAIVVNAPVVSMGDFVF